MRLFHNACHFARGVVFPGRQYFGPSQFSLPYFWFWKQNSVDAEQTRSNSGNAIFFSANRTTKTSAIAALFPKTESSVQAFLEETKAIDRS